MFLVPASLLLILVLLYNTFSSMRMALLIFGNVLLGASGGIFALTLAPLDVLDYSRRRIHHSFWRVGP